MAQMVKNLCAMQETLIQFLGWENPLEKGIATHSCLENVVDRGAWRITVHGVAESRTQLSDYTFTSELLIDIFTFLGIDR